VPPAASTTVELLPLCRRAAVQSSTIDEENRTIELIFTTGAAVRRFDWWTGKAYLEKLSLDPKHVRLDRLNNGAPLLNAHSGYSIEDQIGVVEDGSAKVVGKKAIATVRFSAREAVEPIWRDVKDKIVRNVSVGYLIHKFEETVGTDGAIPTRTATDWEPYEISMVPMPADAGAQTRAGKKPAGVATYPCEIVTRGAVAPADVPTEEPTMSEVRTTPSETIAEMNPLDPGAPTPRATPAVPVEKNDLDKGGDAERERITGIMAACTAARMPAAFMQKMIADKIPLVRAQAMVFEELARRGGDHGAGPQTSDVRVGGEDVLVHARKGIENAILHRVAPAKNKLDDIGRPYRGMSLMDCARAFLQAANIRTTGMSPMQIAGVALGLDVRGGYHTTSDFANLLADVFSKTLRQAYAESPQSYADFVRFVTVPDFKTVSRIQLGEAPALEEVLEHGEFKRGTIADGKEQYALATYGKVFAITRKALVNDDTDAFSRLTALFGRAARQKESDLVWAQITSNPTMGDTNALFSAAHGNLQTDGDVISIASLGRARAAMRIQKGLDGVTLLNITPRLILVPTTLETVADQYMALITPGTAAAANPFSGKLKVIVEPRLDADSVTAWYVAASPDQLDMIEVAHLEGEEGPQVESRVGFDVDGLEVKARLDAAAKVIDWRGFHKDPGELVS